MLMLTIGISGFETGRSHVDTGTAAQAGSAISTHPEFEDALTPDTLSALMRSTWTWDDRALRRDLSTLLVEIAAARGDIGDEAVARALRACGLATGARFVATVLGPHLVADVGSTFRSQFLSAASDPAVFDRSASSARVEVQARAMHYLGTISERVDYPDASCGCRLQPQTEPTDWAGPCADTDTHSAPHHFSEMSHLPGRRCVRSAPTDPTTQDGSSGARSAPHSRPPNGPGRGTPPLFAPRHNPIPTAGR
jgi:hypothetical protein